MAAISFLGDLIQTISDRGRDLIGLARTDLARTASPADLARLCEDLISRRGEASGVALARLILDRYAAFPIDERLAFLELVATEFGADHDAVDAAIAAYRAEPTRARLGLLHEAAEPRSQELIRRLNLARGGTLALVRMREDLFALRKRLKDRGAAPDTIDAAVSLDSDFEHLFASWFNRGFLVLRPIDWSTPAHILEKIIRYEAVHEIADWDELRRRIEPTDRRCYAFFHPALLDEPLIFVEVALTNAIAPAIQPILADGREPVLARAATTAIFYSISNCQKGLAGVTFGNFLIKQVVEDLAREIPSLKTFVTLSPVPGFRTWLDRERGADAPQGLTREDVETLRLLDTDDWRGDKAKCEAVRRAMLPAAAAYFLRAKNEKGRPLDPVARFHLGNGARLERMNFLGDTSKKGMKQSYGLMVNYLYDLSAIEKNHETYVNLGTVATSSAVSRELRSNLPPPRAVVLAEAG
ncbi:malonyl-CoA decarboxylase [Methylorubrum rhodesianum]|jgi:malonyl-CoA decarboxylase|uniref:Malonyl-CoA decarboxylase n=1 Tax=Methylorubrum rhodesianum TaxID=29427 RepID=A0ABU9ZJQ0_9HYPH|nr:MULTISPECIES: malonyl-CoA decarboxylase [Methylorubrum]MBB5764227.1 malonyl-CoA decarboxylase [Methylorubrum rhodesianum]MBI1690079.1 MCD, Malonyl-CoA decarboxylase MCD [Methylorubrum sp. DB1722]MBK3405994.1 malonyl-CoA decarboxylase [Methylorubrum rhodesianum]MBY0141416.1 malonyl-CoA decarboxylase [Methylorubrum populi]